MQGGVVHRSLQVVLVPVKYIANRFEVSRRQTAVRFKIYHVKDLGLCQIKFYSMVYNSLLQSSDIRFYIYIYTYT